MADRIQVERDSLARLQLETFKLHGAGRDALALADMAIQRTESHLAARHQHWTNEVARCEAALERCLSYRDENGYPPPCTNERLAVERARFQLGIVERFQRRAAEAAARYRAGANQLNAVIEGPALRAKAHLATRVAALDQYLRSQAAASSPSGAASGAPAPRIGVQMPPESKEGRGGPEFGG